MPVTPSSTDFFYMVPRNYERGGVDPEQLEDRVAALIKPGSGLSTAYNDETGELLLSLTGGSVSGGGAVKTLDSVFDLKSEPIASKLVSCDKYWPGTVNTGEGGVFIGKPSANYVVDNVKVFAASDGVWIRFSDSNYFNHAGAIGSKAQFFIFQNPVRNYVPNVLLSDKFTSLVDAQAWYPGARILSLTESLNSAALQHAATVGRVNLEKGAYWFNRSIEYFTGMELIGAGSSKTYLVFDADNAFRNRRSLNGASAQDEIYKRDMQFRGFTAIGSAVQIAHNSDEMLVTDTVPFDESKSGFYQPRRNPDLGTPEAQDATPLCLDNDYYDIKFDRFAGHGISLPNGFNYRLIQCSGNNNKGFGLHYIDANSVAYEDNYVGRHNAKGGHWAEGGGVLKNCNGIDNFDKRPAVVFGKPGSVQRVVCAIKGGNLEGTERVIDLHGDASYLEISNASIQFHLADSNYPPIRSYGGICTIVFDTELVSYSYTSPIKTKPTNLLWVKNNGNNIVVRNLPKFQGQDYTYYCANDAGGSIFGLGAGDNRPLKANSRSSFPGLKYGELVEVISKPQQVEKLYIGNQTIHTVDTTDALPTTTATAGLYININAAATATNKLFIKVGDTSTGWRAV